MQKQYSYKITSIIFSVLVTSLTVGFCVMAWEEPKVAPPDGNAELPVNVSGTGQTKTGPLGIGGRDSEFALTADIPGLKGIKVMDGSWFDGAVTSTVDFCLITGECLSAVGGSTLVEGDGISIVADTISVDYSTGLGIFTGQLINTGDLSVTNEIQSAMASKGLQTDGSDDFGLIDCSTDNYILKYDLGTDSWACAADESGAGVTAAFVNIANSGATTQFSASGADTLQFAGGGATAVSFDAVNKRITFTSTDNYAANTDTQDLSIAGHTISLVNGGSVTVPDNYAANTDTQDLSIAGHTISLVNGGSVTVPDNYASCASCDSRFLELDGTGEMTGHLDMFNYSIINAYNYSGSGIEGKTGTGNGIIGSSDCSGCTGYGIQGKTTNGTGDAIFGDAGTNVDQVGVRGFGYYGMVGGAIYAGGWFHGNSYGVIGGGGSYDFYANGAGTNYGPFTGAHEVKLSLEMIEQINQGKVKMGMIVSVTGNSIINDNSISNTLPTIKLADQEADKTVLGAFVKESPLPQDHWYTLEEGERFGIVNALGDGRVWVTNMNGNIETGDLITSSVIPGYGQKQEDDIIRSYTFGKATESVDWEEIDDYIEFDGEEHKAYLIGVVYYSG